jgi:hypothetical protein
LVRKFKHIGKVNVKVTRMFESEQLSITKNK